MQLTNALILTIDTETTGTNVKEDRIVELGGVYLQSGEERGPRLRALVDPERYIPAGATAGVKIYQAGQLRFETVGYGVTVHGTTETQELNVTGVTTTSGDVTIGSGGENSALGVRFNSAYAQIKLPDGQTGANRKGNLSFGDNDDFRIVHDGHHNYITCLLYTSPSPRDQRGSRMPS